MQLALIDLDEPAAELVSEDPAVTAAGRVDHPLAGRQQVVRHT